MQYGGLSLQGTYHDKNQDSFLSCCFDNGYILAVSDGLGSKKNSKIGSQCLCESVLELVQTNIKFDDAKEYLEKLHSIWCKKLSNEKIFECYCTALICVVTSDKIFVARLGDGFVALITDSECVALFDKKEEYFANETDCMLEDFYFEQWEYKIMENSGFKGAIACTDGVGINPNTEDGYVDFTHDFIEGYIGGSAEDTNKDIFAWLSEWPGNDDKTIGYIIRDEV